MNRKIPVITIDGPSGSGKGTIGRLLAARLGWHYLDSGAVYRVVAFLVTQQQLHLANRSAIVALVDNLQTQFIEQANCKQTIIEGGVDITEAIRSEECGKLASQIAALAEVRAALTPYLRNFNRAPGLVADGRDMGTVVFPQASIKIFLTANVAERAKRRLFQLQAGGINATLDTVFQDLRQRDTRDQERSVAPLKPDPAAMIVDTTKLSINEVLQLLVVHVKTRVEGGEVAHSERG